MAASSALVMVCLSGCDFISVWVVFFGGRVEDGGPTNGVARYLAAVRVYKVQRLPCRLEVL